MEADFSGWATKTGLKCSDGRTITPQAFQHMSGEQVPLVWQHMHNSPDNILGHVKLTAHPDGVRCDAFFNKTPQGLNAKALVQHGDVSALSIYANQLIEKSKQVLHGMIREVSLVLSGANPGARIDYISIAHSDGEIETREDEAIIFTQLPLEHANVPTNGSSEPTIKDVYNSLSDVQKNAVNYMIGVALENNMPADAAHSDVKPEDAKEEDKTPETTPETTPDGTTEATATGEGDLTHQEGTTGMTRNVFDQNGDNKQGGEKHAITHADKMAILEAAKKPGNTLKGAVEEYALSHGIENIDLLFPDARAVMDRPEWDTRRTEWVQGVLNGTNHTPFSRIKSLSADLTLDEARAKGYVKGNLKKEQFFGLVKRTTGPSTIYKKQKLDRDDILDIVDFDVVAWLKVEMRFMLEEELARAVLIGDGRAVDDDDKILDPAGASSGNGIRSILNDDDLYAASVYVNVGDASSSYSEVVDAVIASRRLYKGSGQPTFYTTEPVITSFMLMRDTTGRRIYRTIEELASELRVAAVVPVEAMEDTANLLGIIVNLRDYTIGADKGGEVNLFDDFDIDYNQYKYLIETRVSGALTKIRSALVLRTTSSAAALVVPVSPGFVPATNVVTPATTTGVTYKRADTDATVTTGAPITLNSTTLTSLTIYAVPASGSYYFANNIDDEWTFTYVAP